MAENKLTINRNELALNSRKFDTAEISRGIGVQRAKKGKGSYNRKDKHRKQYNWDGNSGSTASCVLRGTY